MATASVPPTTPTDQRSGQARRWPKFLAIGVVALFLGAATGYFAGAPARNDLQSQRDDARAQVSTLTDQRDSLTEQLATSEADLASTTDELTTANESLSTAQADLTESQAALASLADERDGLLASAAATVAVARAKAYFDLGFSEAYVNEMALEGTEFAASWDELLVLLGEDMTLAEWVANSDRFSATEMAIYKTEDTQLIDAWNAWLDSDAGTVAEEVAWYNFMARFDQLMLEALDAG